MNQSKQNFPNWERLSPGYAEILARPVIFLVFAQIAGIAGACFFPHLIWIFLSTAGVLAVLLLILKRPRTLFLIPVFFSIGWFSLIPWTTNSFSQNHVTHFLSSGKVHVIGMVSQRPKQFADRTKFVLDLQFLEKNKISHSVTGKIRVTVRPPVSELCAKTRVAFLSKISSLHNFKNPGGFDYEQYMRFRGIFGSAYLYGKNRLKIIDKPESFMDAARSAVLQLINKSSSPKTRPVLLALVLGEKNLISQELRDSFASAGAAHLLAISGLHMGMVAVFCFFCFRRLLSQSQTILLSGRIFAFCAVLTIIPVVFYGFLAGMSPSTKRAVIMAAVFLLGFVAQRDYDAFNTLAVAAMAILIIRPPALFDISFQLSFSAVFFILYGLKRLPPKRSQITWKQKTIRRLFISLMIPIIATLGTAPIVLYYFDRISIIGPMTNLVVVPLVGFAVLPLALVSALVLPVLPWVAGLMMHSADFILGIVVWLVEIFARLPHASIMPIKPSLIEIFLYYAIVFALFNIRKKAFKWILAGCVIACVIDAGWWINLRVYNPDLRVTVLDVGQSNAALVEFPNGPCMLVDGGGLSSTFDTGRMIVAPYLWKKKIHTVDYMVLTHPQQDHAGGLAYIAEKFKVKQFWANGQPATIKAYKQIMDACEKKGILIPDLAELFKPKNINNVITRALHPAPGFLKHLKNDPKLNDNSLVLKLVFGSQSILFTGDIERKGEEKLVSRWGDKILRSTVCIAPHHGSKTSSGIDFIKAVSPKHVVFCASARNWFGFPDKKVVQRYQKAGAATYTTGKTGSVFIKTDGTDLSVSIFLENNEKRKNKKD